MSGALLGRPCKEKGEQREKKTIMKQDEKDRIPVEGKLENAKRKYGLNRIMTKRSDTSESTIALINTDIESGKNPFRIYFCLFCI